MSKFKLTKDDIAKNLSSKIGCSTSLSKKIVNDFFISASILIRMNRLNFKNIGTFRLIKKKERVGRNPKTKEEYLISSRSSISFIPSTRISKIINP